MDRAPKEWSASEQAERLVGYLEIPPAHWDRIRYGTHVRYYNQTGYRPGGFVVLNPCNSTSGERSMKLQNGFNSSVSTYSQWYEPYAKLERVFVKCDASVLVAIESQHRSVAELNNNIQKLGEYTQKLAERVKALEAGRK